MTDFEDRLRRALDDAAADAPNGGGLAAASRSRARTRRRTTLMLTAVAVVLAVAAVPVGVLALRSDDGRSAAPDVVDSPDPTVEGYRTETWRDLEIQVPASWNYGNLSTWCLNGRLGPGVPVVERPGGAVRAIGCSHPDSGYGAQFFDPATYDAKYRPGEVHQTPDDPREVNPAASWVGYWGSNGDAAVLVVARTEEVARRVLDSARRIDEVDANGCAPELDSRGTAGSEGTVSVCRYLADGWLEQSERLSERDSGAAMAALVEAPLRREQDPCPATPDRFGRVVIGSGNDLASVSVVWDSECAAERGVFFSGVVRELTADVMYWALSPGWSGGVDGSVPLPPELRQR